MNKTKLNLLIFLILITISCGGETGGPVTETTSGNTDSGNGDEVPDETILTDKLIGTPFESMTIGDDVPWCQFLQDQYLTTTITEADLPIPIFLAFFTASEEKIIKQGVQVANTAIGYDLYQVVDTWCDQCRLILKVDTIYDQSAADLGIPESYYADKIGYTIDYNYSFKKTFSSTVVTDWAIEIRSDRIESLGWQIIAHELGHAIGIQLHTLIDYVNDDVVDLEPDSIMEAIVPLEPILIDYTFMMQKQFEILQAHYGQTEEFPGGICP